MAASSLVSTDPDGRSLALHSRLDSFPDKTPLQLPPIPASSSAMLSSPSLQTYRELCRATVYRFNNFSSSFEVLLLRFNIVEGLETTEIPFFYRVTFVQNVRSLHRRGWWTFFVGFVYCTSPELEWKEKTVRNYDKLKGFQSLFDKVSFKRLKLSTSFELIIIIILHH